MAYSFDDAWDNGPEVTRAGTAAFGLYCRCGAWSARNLTDGFIPSEIAAAYGTPEWARKLADAGLWEIIEGGYSMPHFLDRNQSRDQVVARRRADAERKRKWREKSHRDSQRSPPGGNARNPRFLLPTPKGVKGAPAREDAAGSAPQLTPKCDDCDRNRMVELDDGRLQRCPNCHPLREVS